MDDDLRGIIQGLIREEARTWVSDHQELIRDVVRETVIPEMRKAIRAGIAQEMKGRCVEATAEWPPVSPTEPSRPDPVPVARPKSPPVQDSSMASAPALAPADKPDDGFREGLYVYGVVKGDEGSSLGPIGLEEQEVFVVAFEDLAAVVHRCPARPYQSSDEEKVKAWAVAHQRVVDAAWEWFGNVIPVGFDTIIQGAGSEDVAETVRKWLREDQDRLREKLNYLDGMAEYGIQVFWDPEAVARNRARQSPEIQRLEKEIQSKPKGAAYLYRQKLEKALKEEMERLAGMHFQELLDRIRPHVKALKVEKNKPAQGARSQMLMNLSCLAPRQHNQELGVELESIESMEGLSVRFTGPWPAYSFV